MDRANPNIMNNPKNIALVVAAVAGSLTLWSCTDTPAEQSDEMNAKMDQVQEKMEDASAAPTLAAWENERNDILSDLRSMRDDIDAELGRCNERLAGKGLKPSERTDELAMQAELMREKTTVEELIARVEGSSEGTWVAVKEDTRKASEEVQGWWARFKDNIDKKTRSDKDMDGH